MGYYNMMADGYDELHGEEQRKKLALIKAHLDIHPRRKLLDVGCGTGISTDFDCQCYGIDPSEEMIRKAKAKGGADYRVAYAEDIPFEDNFFDIVISLTSVHNFNNIEKSLEEIKRVAKDWIVISVLKKSPKAEPIKDLILKKFKVEDRKEEEKDIIYFLKKA